MVRAPGNGVEGQKEGGGVGPGAARGRGWGRRRVEAWVQGARGRRQGKRGGGSARAAAAPGGGRAGPCAVWPAPRSESPRRLLGRPARGAGRGRSKGRDPAAPPHTPGSGCSFQAESEAPLCQPWAWGNGAAGKGGGGATGRGRNRREPCPQPSTGGRAPAAAPWALLEEVGEPGRAPRRGDPSGARGGAPAAETRAGRGPGRTAAVAAADL